MIPFPQEKAQLLYLRLADTLSENNWPLQIREEKETGYTQRNILPFILKWVNQLNEGALHVRGDGGLNPLPIIWDEISLYPDLTIMYFHERLLAIEVKFLRTEDPGGSLTKAIGQALMYEKAGFKHAIAMIFDSRKLKDSHMFYHSSQRLKITDYSSALYLKPSSEIQIQN